MQIPPLSLSDGQLEQLRKIVGENSVKTSKADRWAASRDMWPKTIMWTRHDKAPHVPDALVLPQSTEQVSGLLSWAASSKVPVVPYGAGSGVCGGTLPLENGVVIDLKRMNRLLDIDLETMTADVEPGMYGERLERALNTRGLTFGHFPSSIYCSSVGGYAAARSAGQASSRYGKMEDMVVSMEVVLADGQVVTTQVNPALTASPDMNHLFMGSEGTLGIITRVKLRVRKNPEYRRFMAYHFPSVEAGLDAMRQTMQAGLQPAVLRLYDEFDTIVAGTHGTPTPEEESSFFESRSKMEIFMDDFVGFMKKNSMASALKRPWLLNRMIRRLPGKCLLVAICEGEPKQADMEADKLSQICRSLAKTDLGEGPARYWMKHRHKISYKQSKLFDAGAWVDTMEVAIKWSEVARLYDAVRKAVQDDVFIMAHFSHAYVDGCCVYFSFSRSSSNPDAEIKDYDKVWRKALQCVHDNGGTITHHHGVGYNKGAFLPLEYGEMNSLFTETKTKLDPDNIMNPGKLGLKI